MKSEWNQSSVCLTFSRSPALSLMTKTHVSFDVGLVLGKTLVRGDIGNENPTPCFDLCLEGPAALALMNWRGGCWSPTPTAMASPYRVRQTSSGFTAVTSTSCTRSSSPSSCLSDTTREKRRQESEGVDYHFVSVHMFEEDILNNRYYISRCSCGFLKNSLSFVSWFLTNWFVSALVAFCIQVHWIWEL